MQKLAVLIFMLVTIVSGCSTLDVTPPSFDGERAMQYLIDQVDFGPRVPGSTASQTCREFIKVHFDSLGFSIDSQSFMFLDPYSLTDTPLVNLIASFTATEDEAPSIVLMAHYDSRPRTDYAVDKSLLDQPIDGANDGASGVAVLMEIGNLFAETPPPCNVDIVMSDGEDWGKPRDHDHYLLGARHFSAQGIRGKYDIGLVVDLIGDANQEIYREKYSQRFNPELNDLVWNTASELNITTFLDSTKHTVLDDHIPLNVGGIPTIVIIDFDYPYWHTEFDTPDKCSAESLENVGRVLAKIIYTPSSWPKQK